MGRPTLIVSLALIAAVAACAPLPPSAPRYEVPDVYEFARRSHGEASEILSHPESCEACRRLSGTFTITWEMHFGFRLQVDQSIEHDMIPVFGPGTLEKFQAARFNGLICECSGWVVEHDGIIYFRIDEARVFERAP